MKWIDDPSQTTRAAGSVTVCHEINRRGSLFLIAAVAAIGTVASTGETTATEVGMIDPVKLQSAYPFKDTVAKLRTALERKGLTVFAEIDQQQAARSVGLQMPPTILLIYGNPKGGTPLMLAAPDFALELPLKLLIREEDESRVLVVYTPASMLDGRYGLPSGLAAKLAGAEPVIAETVGVSPK